jgi:hypothetical protein
LYEEEKRRTNALLFRFFSKLLAISKLPAAERDDACDGTPLMDVRRARDGWIWHGFGVAMTDDDTNEETARPPPNDALPAI